MIRTPASFYICSRISILLRAARRALFGERPCKSHRRAEPKRLHLLCHLLELCTNLDFLRAAFLASAAFPTKAGIVMAGPECARYIHILATSHLLPHAGRRIVCGKAGGDIHSMGAGHAVAAGGTAYFEGGVERFRYFPVYPPLIFPNGARQSSLCHSCIFQKLLLRTHPAEHYCCLWLIPDPPSS